MDHFNFSSKLRFIYQNVIPFLLYAVTFRALPKDCNHAQLMLSPALPTDINLLQPTGYVMHQQFNIQQLYAPPTLYLCVLYLSENKQRFVPLTT